MSTMLTVEQFPNEMALIMAHLAEQASLSSDKRKLYNCGKLFCFWPGDNTSAVGLVDLETKSVKRIRELIDDNGIAVFLAKYVELEDKTDG